MSGVVKFLLLLASIIVGWALAGVALFWFADKVRGRGDTEGGPAPDGRSDAGLSLLDHRGPDDEVLEQ